jgi:hypothetical protein
LISPLAVSKILDTIAVATCSCSSGVDIDGIKDGNEEKEERSREAAIPPGRGVVISRPHDAG